MPRLLLEDTYRFVPDKTALTERINSKSAFPIRLPGLLSECDVVNGNNRRYSKRVWEKNLAEGSTLRKLMAERAAFGLVEHPKDGTVNLQSPICLILTDLRLEDKKVVGEVTLVNTAEGHKMWALIEAGYNPLVSSRGFGSVVKGNDGVDEVQEDYVCEGWDMVSNPSFVNARLDATMARESASATDKPKAEALTAESKSWAAMTQADRFTVLNKAINDGQLKAESLKLDGDKLVVSATAVVETANTLPPQAAQPQTKIKKDTNMEKLTAVRESLNSLRATDLATLEPDRLAKGLTRMEDLHRELAAVAAEDPKSSWDVSSLHEEIRTLEQTWKQVAQAPKVELGKLTEAQTKLMKVIHATAETALKYREKLGQSIKEAAKLTEDRKTFVARGKGWMERANKAESQLATVEKRLALCYEGLDEFTKRYNEDITAVGRRLLQLEFKPDEATQKAINEAKKPAELVAIRAKLEGKEAPVDGKPIDEAKKPEVKVETKTVGAGLVSETKEVKVPVAAPLVKTEVTPVAEVTSRAFVRPFSVAESFESARRMSLSPAAK